MSAIARIAESLPATLLAVAALSAAAVGAVVYFFEQSVSLSLALYFVIWWTFLFAVLPFGVRSQAEDGAVVAGSDPGAPSVPGLQAKAIWATILAGIILVIVAFFLPLLEL